MFREEDTSKRSTIMFKTHAESLRNLVAYIMELGIPNSSDICLLYVLLWTMKRQGNLYII